MEKRNVLNRKEYPEMSAQIPQITFNLPRQSVQVAIPGVTEPQVVKGITIPIAPNPIISSQESHAERRKRNELRSQARFRESGLLQKEIGEIEFSLYSTKDIDKIAVVNITDRADYGKHTVRSLYMGPHNDSQVCDTCSNDLKNCPGHYGKIVLPRLMHPMTVKSIEAVLTCVCNSCSGFLSTREELEQKGILRMRGERRLQAIKELIKDTHKTCTRYAGRTDVQPCTVNPIYLPDNKEDYRLRYKWSEKDKIEFTLPPDTPPNAPPDHKSIYKILNCISVTDAELLGFTGNSHPRNMIIDRLIVIPYCARPDLTFGDRFQPDDFTYIYKEIVSKVIQYNQSKDNEAAAEIALKNLYYVVSHLMKNDGKYHQGGRRVPNDITKRLQGKNGIVRSNIMGKRVNFAGRTVVGPGHTMRVDQTGVPREMANKLTRPIKVFELNRAELQAKYDSGEVKHITMQSGKWAGVRRAITDAFRKEFVDYRLQIGDVVERILQDGDIVITNRQPSLHKGNMLVTRAVIIDDRIIRLNLSQTTPQNADFDGDEINIHVPQTIESYAEAEQLLHVARNLMAPQRNEPMMGIVYDALSGAYAMTLPQHLYDQTEKKLKKLNRDLSEKESGTEEYNKIQSSIARAENELKEWKSKIELDPIIYNYAISRVMDAPQFETLYKRLAKYGVQFNTGRGLLSAVFPEDFDYEYYDVDKDNRVVVKEGILISGLLDKKTIGRSDGSMIQEMYKQLGGMITVDFMSDIQFVVNAYLEQHGLSVGIDDCIPTDPDFQSKIDSIMTTATMSAMSATLSEKTNNPILEEQRERKIVAALEKGKTLAEAPVKEFFTADNAIMIMGNSGAKGSILNAVQMSAVLGQQKVSNKRIVADLPGNRSLPVFRPTDTHPRSRGMCYNSFGTGLEPAEFFFYSANARESLTDTAINTAQTGFLQHQIIKSAEDIYIAADGSVRSVDETVVQFVYGDDGMDASELTTIKINGENVPFFRHIQQLANKINRQYGAI